MDIDHRYTWVLPRSAWWIRLYLWVWAANPREITFCKLWWGYVLMWVGLPVRTLIAAFYGMVRLGEALVGAARRARRQRRERKQPEPSKPILIECRTFGRRVVGRPARWMLSDQRWACWYVDGVHVVDGVSVAERYGAAYAGGYHALYPSLTMAFATPGLHEIRAKDYGDEYTLAVNVLRYPAPQVRLLQAVATGASRGVMASSSAAGAWARRPTVQEVARKSLDATTKTAKWSGITAGGLILLGILGGLGWGIYWLAGTAHIWGPDAVSWVPPTAHYVATHAAHAALIMAAIIVGATLGLGLLFAGMASGLFAALRSVIAEPLARGTKHGTMGFARMMVIGYKAVKSNTCPRVVVEEDSTR